MENLNLIIANNLVILRKREKLTQQEFGDKFSYSNKTVSKWEIGSVVPSVEILKEIADFYGVTVDYILNEHKDEKDFKNVQGTKVKAYEKFIVIGLFFTIVWALAAVIFGARIVGQKEYGAWLAFIYAIPASALISSILLKRFFKNEIWSLVGISITVWTAILSAFLQALITLKVNYWFFFLVGVPIQTLLLLLIIRKKIHK